MNKETIRATIEMHCARMGFLSIWFCALWMGMVPFSFLHECGHGVGARIDGIHVGTGFIRVGEFGKRPGDPDFRSNQLITGELNASSWSGPFMNWVCVVLFTVFLLRRARTGRTSLLPRAGAIVHAWERLLPMALFFFAASCGRIRLEDEVAWGLTSVANLPFPMPFIELFRRTNLLPEAFFSESEIYFRTLVSFLISTIGLLIAYRQLYRLFHATLSTRVTRPFFWVMPLLVLPLGYALLVWLAALIRIHP